MLYMLSQQNKTLLNIQVI